MFTGIIQALGTVVAADSAARSHAGGARAHRLEIDLGPLADGLALGASVAVNGACLTVAELRGTVAGFDVVPETWRRTNLESLKPGAPVHLERSLRVGDPLDGHFVQGHVDGVGVLERVERAEGEWKLHVRAEAVVTRFIVPKGAVALDGTSLTVVDASANVFSVALVPTTLARTLFTKRRPGDRLNIETDILARLVIGRLDERTGVAPGGSAGGVRLERLREEGFLT